MEGLPPRRARRWSLACTNVIAQIAIVITLGALVAWPERHVPCYFRPNAPPGYIDIAGLLTPRATRDVVYVAGEFGEFMPRPGRRIYPTRAHADARRDADRQFRADGLKVCYVGPAPAWTYRDDGLRVLLGRLLD